MDWGHILFGFSGRINRAKIWLWLLINVAVWIVVGIIAGIITGVTGSAVPLIIAYVIVGIGSLVSYFAVVTKRLHDRNKSAMWLLIFLLVPLLLSGISAAITMSAIMSDGGAGGGLGAIGTIMSLVGFAIAIWAFVELWCLRGTVGPNQYGPDPLEGKF